MPPWRVWPRPPAALSASISTTQDPNTEYLARAILARIESGQDAEAPLTLLANHKNADGGYGGDTGHASNALDTAWALLAYKAART
jgi:hypothetical protein